MKGIIILLIVALAVSSMGWKRFVYFISLGYGFSIAACAVAIAAVYWQSLTLSTVLLCAMLFVYGIRLGGYLLIREIKSASYRKALAENVNEGTYPFGVTMAVWLACAILYVGEVSPVAFRLANTESCLAVNDVWAWIGLVVMALGIIMESAADLQKSAAKKKDPNRFVNMGLYRIVRCPNYFGEMLTWTGCLLVCVGASCNGWQWALALVGYLGIVYVMFSGARRLEIRQNKHYGDDPEYRQYVKKTPILIPLVPIYSVERHKWLRG